MDTPEIRRIAIESAESYYRYLDQNDKGLQEVQVYDIIAIPGSGQDDVFKLRLSAKLFDIDAVVFKYLPTNRRYTTSEIKIVEYDPDKNVLLIKPEKELLTIFKRLPARDLKVISDLKFLIERVKKWYEQKGGTIIFPENASVLSGSFYQIKYLQKLEPSVHQQQALRLVFQAPFSYIWGAPGTGKTQFVLAYAVLHYIGHKKRVAIMAPTNNAIEQVLRGVLKMTDKAGISRSGILRLGVPSRKFAEEFPEVCEERGIMKKLEELDKQVEKQRKILAYAIKRDRLEKTHEQWPLFSKFNTLEEQQQATKLESEKREEEFIRTEAQLATNNKLLTELAFRQKTLQKKIDSVGIRLTKLFTSRPVKAEIELGEVGKKLTELGAREQYWRGESIKKRDALHKAKESLIKVENEIKDLMITIKEAFGFTDELRSIVMPLHGKNRNEVRLALEKQVKEEKLKNNGSDGLFHEYEFIQTIDIEKQLEKLLAIKSKMASASTEERLKGVSVIACTLDGYIGRFTDTVLDVDHVFMDEAGYSNIIKALTIFNRKGPVTFLGDHMQLPPVCEINDSEIGQKPEYNNIFLWAQSAIFLEHVFAKPAEAMLREYLEHNPMKVCRMQMASLTHTFRFGKKLAAILDAHVYTNGFKSSLELGDTKIFFVHAPKAEPPKSRISMGEVHAIRDIVERLGPHEDFIILTPYKRQVDSLGKTMPDERNDLKILTVHGSQGREWNTVILSVVDTGDKWFVDSRLPLSNGLNLLNTAVSRTKKQLIIVCDYRYWKGQQGQLVTDLLAVAEEIKLVG